MNPDKFGGLEKFGVARTCLGWGSYISEKAYWNPVRIPDMSDFSGKLDWKAIFDDLHFTNSLNASHSTKFLGHK
jgi:hypothetical protein